MTEDKKERPHAVRGRKSGVTFTQADKEKFAQEIVAGKNNGEALRAVLGERAAKWKPTSLNREGFSWAHNEWVAARVAELRAETARTAKEKIGLDRTWVIEKLREVIDRCMTAEPVLEKDGTPTGEYTFNAAGANRALELVGKEIGMFVDRKEIRTGALESMSDDELRATLDALRKLTAGTAAGASPTVQ